MTDARVSRVSVEVLVAATDIASRVSRVNAEALIAATDVAGRVSRVSAEAIIAPNTIEGRISRLSVEVLQSEYVLLYANINGTSSVSADLFTAVTGELNARPAGTVTISAFLGQVQPYLAAISGSSSVAAQLDLGGIAGFEIPYLVGQGGQHIVELEETILGTGLVTATLTHFNNLRSTPAGTSTVSANLSRHGGDNMRALINGTSTVTAEIFVNAIRNLSCTINGKSTIFASPFVALHNFDPRSQSYMYLYSNIGVGFDPTDIYPGATSQTFPDGHTRDDFHEYLYIYSSIGAGFDPTDEISDHPAFVDQIFPDGHTAFDFHEYLYLYLNVVLGSRDYGQLVIRPGFTRGPNLPSSKPPRLEPS